MTFVRSLLRLPRQALLATLVSAALLSPLTASAEGSVRPLPAPAALTPLVHPARVGEGVWSPQGRRVQGHEAVYTTCLLYTSDAADE